MSGLYANLAALMASRNISLSRTPFNPDVVVIKRASFPKGETPEHLKPYLLENYNCINTGGSIVYKGKIVPRTAACVAASYDKVEYPVAIEPTKESRRAWKKRHPELARPRYVPPGKVYIGRPQPPRPFEEEK